MATIRIEFGEGRFSGIDLTFSKHGVDISGFYDSMVGLEGGFIPWDELETIKAYCDGEISAENNPTAKQ